ncbi:hypothetical protein [Terrisporobacter glycolicus]|uniref:Uncharacterized protein n=1 Tax=Terrisporobacter glycolicus ATCC 14880 = DSM 1288 TaxID=1121315 RepID=A0ABZ2ERS5_9FIRM|nr:hypothetical protein [Terrisporobacter glycolicus]
MYHIFNLKFVYKILNEMKFDLFCDKRCYHKEFDDCHNDFKHCEKDCIDDMHSCQDHEDCECDEKHHENCHDHNCCDKERHPKEVEIIRNITENFLEEDLCIDKLQGWNKDCNCISLLDVLMTTLFDIEECTNCKKNYGYLLQIDKFECILKNLKNLLCQLKCLFSKRCDLISDVLCKLFKIIDLIESIISKISNIECLCKSHMDCKCELIECMVCELEDEINSLENVVLELASTIFELASKEILNCTACGVSECEKDRKRNSSKKHCEGSCYKN